ncbi:MAG: hypothetical protein ABFD92_04650 [Planctomycetaceae bacterium]|nr:hypothetical protein [Planctomycetaceae bacterium]
MKKSSSKNGSALLMVVGLLTILAMLGGTFLIVASTHRKVAGNVIAASPLNEAQSGAAAQVVQLLKSDLFLDALGPYSLAKGAATDDEYLAWYADTAVSDVLKQPLKAAYNLSQGTYDGYTLVDTNGDLVPDARLVPIPNMTNENGVQIYIAVSVEDLGSKLNTNTAGEVGLALTPSTPAEVYLKQFLDSDLRPYYTSVHDARRGTAAADLASYSTGAALKAGGLPSTTAYNLFTMDDELQLRWRGYCSGAKVGRLYNVLHTFSKNGELTTMSRSRSLLRHPTAALKKRLSLYSWDATENLVLNRALLDDDATRTWFYEEMKKALGAKGGVEPQEVIMDNAGSGVTFTGTWGGSTTLPGYYGTNYSWANAGSNTACFTPGMTAAANYNVYLWWTASAARPTNASVTVVYKGGTDTKTVNQRVNGSQWNLLGKYAFEAGTLGNVTISAAGADGVVTADAVRFEPLPPDPIPIPPPVIMDNTSAGVAYVGTWALSTSLAGFWATNYAWCGAGNYTATFTPNIPVSGEYEVYMWWTASSSRPTNLGVDVKYASGTASHTVNQQTNGSAWNLLGTYRMDPGTGNSVTLKNAGINGISTADGVKFVCISTEPESDGPAETGMVDHFVANLWAYLSNLDPTTHAFKVGKAYGVVPQLVISEAFAQTYPESNPGVGDHGWAYAIELMNPTNQSIPLGNYAFSSGTASEVRLSTIGCPANLAAGAKIVLYSFGGKKFENRLQAATANDAALFGVSANVMGWKRVGDSTSSLLDFAQANTAGGAIKLYRLVTDNGNHVIPVDSVTGADIGFTIKDPKTETRTGSPPTPFVGMRDDSWATNFGGRGRAIVAAMEKKTLHSLGLAADNGITDDSINASPVSKGFFIRKGETIPATLGEVLGRFIVGPEAETAVTEYKDLPRQLLALAASQTRGKLDYKGEAPAAWTKDYPNINFSCVIPELLQMLPTHDSVATGVQYGLININTASKKVLSQLPFPLTLKMGATDVTEWNSKRDTHIAAIADAIIAKRDATPYTTPGAVAADIVDYTRTKVLGSTTGLGYYEAQNALWNAVSNCVTVSSDIYAVYIRVQLGSAGTQGTKFYVAIIDRSNCKLPTDQPAILMTTRVE